MPESHITDCVAVITSAKSEAIAAASDGAVMKLEAHDGDSVHAGQVIAHLDKSELQSQLEKAEGDKARAAGEAGRAYAEAENAERKARLASRMVAAGVESESALNDARSTAAGAGAGGGAAAGAERAAESQIKEAKRLLDLADLKAPIDGILANIKFHEGEVPHRGQTIARVFDPTQLQIKFALPRNKAEAVKPGDHVDMFYGTDHKVGATVKDLVDNHDVTIDFYTVVADLDKNTRPGDLQVGVRGVIHIADKGVAR
ncbi:MAG TPA: biotin/lipoyl-binding protein [Kofleriaceae bacterium]|jgi:RND family efflux transporter MFP subunit|nr:biotin/lipoyl-binding protein [Kofleriaceae bacterium]